VSTEDKEGREDKTGGRTGGVTVFIECNALASEVDGVGALSGTVPDGGGIVCLVVVFACRDFVSENGRLIWVQTESVDASGCSTDMPFLGIQGGTDA